jgi:hypothetical protein
VELGVGDPSRLGALGQARGGMDELGAEEAPDLLEADRAVGLPAHQRHLALGPLEGTGHRLSVGGLDLGASVRIRRRPEGRDQLRRGHHQLDRGDPGPVSAGRAERSIARRRAPVHHLAQVGSGDRGGGVETEGPE